MGGVPTISANPAADKKKFRSMNVLCQKMLGKNRIGRIMILFYLIYLIFTVSYSIWNSYHYVSMSWSKLFNVEY